MVSNSHRHVFVYRHKKAINCVALSRHNDRSNNHEVCPLLKIKFPLEIKQLVYGYIDYYMGHC